MQPPSELQTIRRGAWSTSILAAGLLLGTAGGAIADEAYARQAFQAMSDFMGSQTALAFDYNSSLDVVTDDKQKLAIASSGRVAIERPGKLHAMRHGGFAMVELGFDGQSLTILNKDTNHYAKVDLPGSIETLVDTLRDTYHRPLPAADLLLPNAAETLMPLFSDVKDLGSGVIGGVECDHLALRTDEVDLQIWIAQGDEPYPCRYVISNTRVEGWPEYRIDISNFQTGKAAMAGAGFELPAGATQVDLKAVPDVDELSGHYSFKGDQ